MFRASPNSGGLRSNSDEGLRLLHLEDNDVDARLLELRVQAEWPNCHIQRTVTESDFSAALSGAEFDVIVSDFALGQYTGMEALRLARDRAPHVPFLFLSGTIGEEHAVGALHYGAADYILKDRPARLVPAIRAALDRTRDTRLRRAAEQRLQEQAELLDKARDAICVTDLGGQLTYWNQSASALFGWAPNEDPGRNLVDLFGQANRTIIAAALRELPAAGAWTRELAVIHPSGAVRHIISRWTLVKDARQQPKSILLINTDLTEQKKLETLLLRSQRLESIGTLAGGIAHDLNNVLAPILMAVNLLRDEITDEATLRTVDVLETSVHHGSGLIRQVLAFARGAEGERTELKIALVIQEVLALLKETLPRAIAIETKFDSELWSVIGNATQVSQVLMNLGVNARDAISGNGVLLISASNCLVDEELARVHQGSAGKHVRIVVADTGSGIAPEVIGRIFDPFFTTKAAGKGTGLGLSTVLGIVKSHGGFLEVQSELGRGTQFRIYFPASDQPAQAPAPAAEVRPTMSGRGLTLLIIEDDAAVRAVITVVLRGRGFRVITAANGEDGVKMYRNSGGAISAVITDIMMPGIQGAEVIRQLREINPAVKIVAMSGVLGARPETQEEPGKLVFMAKPMSADDVVRALQGLGVGIP